MPPLGHLEAELALGMRGAERPQGLPGPIQAVCALDGHPEGSVVQQLTQELPGSPGSAPPYRWCAPPCRGRGVRRCAAAARLEGGVGLEVFGCVGDEVEEASTIPGTAMMTMCMPLCPMHLLSAWTRSLLAISRWGCSANFAPRGF